MKSLILCVFLCVAASAQVFPPPSSGGAIAAGSTGALQNNGGSGSFGDSGCSATSGALQCGSPGQTGQTTYAGGTSGSAAVGAAVVAGSPAKIQLPIATGAANGLFQTDGNNPQQTSWTTTPTIPSFTNATHNHLNAAGGGTLTPFAGTFTMKSGRYYDSSTQGGFGTALLQQGTEFARPFFVPQSVTFDRICVHITTGGGSGAVIRLGIYNNGPNGEPTSLVVDAGTVVGTGTGSICATISQALAAGWYWVSATGQGSPSPQPTLAMAYSDSMLIGFTGTDFSGDHGSYFRSSITGALSTPWAAWTSASESFRIVLRVQ